MIEALLTIGWFMLVIVLVIGYIEYKTKKYSRKK
jgi:hypothetical protein